MSPNRSYLTPNLKLFSIFSMWAETHTYEEERGSIDLIWTACLKKLILPRFLLKPSGFSSVFGLWVKLCGALWNSTYPVITLRIISNALKDH